MTSEVSPKVTEEVMPETKRIDTEEPVQLTGEALKDAIRKQVEYYFSRENLSTDTYPVSQMNSQNFVPISIVAGFHKVKHLTDDVHLIADAVRNSKVCNVSEDGSAIRPSIRTERNTIILREIPSATSEEEVRAIFDGCGEIVSVRSDVGDTWFVTASSEGEAVNICLKLKEKTFQGKPIKARLKSENILRSFYPMPSTGEAVVQAYVSGAVAPPPYYMHMPWMGGYGPQGPGYGMVPPGNPPRGFGRGPANNNFQGNDRFPRRAGRGPGGQPRGPPGPANPPGPGPHGAQGPMKDRKAPHPQADRANPRKTKDKKHKVEKKVEKQPILNAANFPPLPTSEKSKSADAHSTGYQGDYQKYSHDEIMEIIKHMDDNDCQLPEGSEFKSPAYALVVSDVAHPELLRNQRTYSIEQAREALRQGRPIRSDSIGSADYESMIYGEEYTKEVRQFRETRKQAVISDSVASAASPAASSQKPASPRAAKPEVAKEVTPPVVKSEVAETAEEPKEASQHQKPAIKKSGYAAAVLSNPGVPAPAPQRPKAPAAPKKDDKKDAKAAKPAKGQPAKEAPKKHAKPAKKADAEAAEAHVSAAAAAAEAESTDKLTVETDSAPEGKASAWGGKRSFVDVLKTTAPAPAPTVQSPTAQSSGSLTPSSKAPKEPTKSPKKERDSDREGRKTERSDRRQDRTLSPKADRRAWSPKPSKAE